MLVESSTTRTPVPKLLTTAGAVQVALIAITALFYGCSKPATGIQQSEDLGSGFRRVTIGKMDKGQLVNYPFFFYKDTPICQLGGPAAPSVSPSGNFGVCQDVRSGKLMLFRRRDEKIVPLTATPFGLATRFVWHEEDGSVEAEVGKEGMSGIFPLK